MPALVCLDGRSSASAQAESSAAASAVADAAEGTANGTAEGTAEGGAEAKPKTNEEEQRRQVTNRRRYPTCSALIASLARWRRRR